MKTLIAYYSHTGKTKKLAEALAAETGAELLEVRYLKRPGRLGTVLRGCPAAVAQKPAKTPPIAADFAAYGSVVVMAPVWAGHPAPPFNSILHALPAGTKVELRLVSSSGGSEKGRVVAKAEELGLVVDSYTDVKAPREQ